jgi:glycosyltransferase involved in cell wall biosynthesis
MTVVSVVIPTRGRPAALARCLAGLAAQEHAGALEVVVVDDGSPEPEAVITAAGSSIRVRLPGDGPAAARNAGVQRASGEIILFIDDDCFPAPGWVAALTAAIVDGKGDVVAGRTVPAAAADEFVRASELIVERLRSKQSLVTTNNVACRREVALSHPFDVRYRHAAGEDREWTVALLAAGIRIGREERAVVAHDPPAGARAYWRRHARYGTGAHVFRGTAVTAGVGWPLHLDLLRAGFRVGPRSGLLVLLAQFATAAGFARSWLASR